jgi:hypothetical protein
MMDDPKEKPVAPAEPASTTPRLTDEERNRLKDAERARLRSGEPLLSGDAESWRKAWETTQAIEAADTARALKEIEKSRRPDGTIPGEAEQDRIQEDNRQWLLRSGIDPDKKSDKGSQR